MKHSAQLCVLKCLLFAGASELVQPSSWEENVHEPPDREQEPSWSVHCGKTRRNKAQFFFDESPSPEVPQYTMLTRKQEIVCKIISRSRCMINIPDLRSMLIP